MDLEQIKTHFRKRDRVISVLSEDGFFRVAIINNTQAAITAQQKHKLASAPAELLSKQLAAASLIAVFLKGEERVILETMGDGPISKVYTEAIQVGESRGFVSLESNQITNFATSENLFGNGLFRVTKVLYSKPEPVTGVVELQNGDISSELTYYFFQSEQIPTAVILDVQIDDNGNISGSSGIFVQALPGATDYGLEQIYLALSKMESLNELFEKHGDNLNVLKNILPFDFNLIKNDIVDFYCRCSKDSFKSKLMTLNLEELREMKNQGHNELVCQFCNSNYYLDDSDFDELIAQMQARNN